jgi:hypothetical protein
LIDPPIRLTMLMRFLIKKNAESKKLMKKSILGEKSWVHIPKQSELSMAILSEESEAI